MHGGESRLAALARYADGYARLLARSDEDIRADLERRVAEELEALRQAVVEVRDGVVTVDADGPCRQLVEQLARTVPGVVEVRSRRPDPAP